jgi:hypothetical protein
MIDDLMIRSNLGESFSPIDGAALVPEQAEGQ